MRRLSYLTVSTGIGGAIVTGGHLVRGPDGTAGELGHLMVNRDGPLCGCGVAGHLEATASGSDIARAARSAAERGGSDLPTELILTHGASFGAREVAAAEGAGDPVAARLMASARDAFAVSCVSLADVFNPSLIVVSGSLAVGRGERLLGPAREAVASPRVPPAGCPCTQRPRRARRRRGPGRRPRPGGGAACGIRPRRRGAW